MSTKHANLHAVLSQRAGQAGCQFGTRGALDQASGLRLLTKMQMKHQRQL